MKEMQCREGMWRVPVSCRLKRRKPHRDAGDILAAFRMLGKGGRLPLAVLSILSSSFKRQNSSFTS